jgi:hypothetical protein
MPAKALVIDANILVRAVLGRRVREIIETYAERASFFVPEVAYAEAEEHLPALVIRRGGDPDKALKFLRSLRGLVDLIGSDVYNDFELGRPGSGRLADIGSSIGDRLSDLDGRHRLVRMWRAHLDDQPSFRVSARGFSLAISISPV